MSRNTREFRCTPEQVFRVLNDGWLFPSWVVGASRMRDVAEAWPATGSKLYHSFGVWPALTNDTTIVEEYQPPHRIVLRAKGWPIGEARVVIELKARGAESTVRIFEQAVAGPGRLMPRALLDPVLHWRNRETLHRLAYLAEGMSDTPSRITTAEEEE